MKSIFTSLLLSAAVLLLAGCSRERLDGLAGGRVDVSVAFDGNGLPLTKAFTGTHDVDRVLLIPFAKIDRSGADTYDNFTPESDWIRQVDVNDFPVAASLSLIPGMEYIVLAIGYNHTGLDYDTQGLTGTGFGMAFAGDTALLSDMVIGIPSPYTYPFAAPELFRCFCTPASGEQVFTASDTVSLTGDLTRMVSGLSLQISNIPDDVTSIDLRAEMLTYSITATSLLPMLYDTSPETDNNLIGSQTPVSGAAAFDTMLFPTAQVYSTKLHVDIIKNGNTERHEIKVNDLEGVSSDSAITLTPNGVVSISGDYDKIDTGFTVTGSQFNLDSDNWDGVQ